MTGSLQPSRHLGLALLVAATTLPSCGDAETSPQTDAPEDTETSRCTWETQALLSNVNAPTPDLNDCGRFNGADALDNDCFATELETGQSVQFHIYRESDIYGDELRVVRVESCTRFIAGAGTGANCADPETLYSCSEPR